MDSVDSGRKINAYGFVTRTAIPPRQFVDSVLQVSGIRFAGRTVGSSVAVVAACVDSLTVLQDEVLPAVADHGARNTMWTVAAGNAAMFNMPVKRGKSAYSALVRARTPRAAETLNGLVELFGALNTDQMAGHHASALQTYGANCDVLLDVGAPDEDALFVQMDRLDDVPAVTTYEVELAHWADNGRWDDD
jgi:hypothetical protein